MKKLLFSSLLFAVAAAVPLFAADADAKSETKTTAAKEQQGRRMKRPPMREMSPAVKTALDKYMAEKNDANAAALKKALGEDFDKRIQKMAERQNDAAKRLEDSKAKRNDEIEKQFKRITSEKKERTQKKK